MKIRLSDCYERLIKLNFAFKKPLPLKFYLEKAILVREELVMLNPVEHFYKMNLAAAYGQLAYAAAEIFKNKLLGIENYQKALSLWEQLLQESPENPEYQRNFNLITEGLNRLN